MPTLRSLAALALLLLAAAPGATHAAAPEPVMPLADVRPGMQCQGASVIQGTQISTFDVEIVDVVTGDAAANTAFLLFRASGPAVDRTGIGPGFSGSPIRCPTADGSLAIAGAISLGIGEYGGLTGLATPIESVLGEPVQAPAGASVRTALVARARPIAVPLSLGGLAPPVARAVQAAGRKAGRVVYAAPVAPQGSRPTAAPLVPGAAMAVGLSSGDLTAGAIGTVAYTRDDEVWAFGHPLDSVGARSLFLQDAYVYTVVNNPLAVEGASSYKLAAAGRNVGTLSYDGISAVAGRLGALPPSFPMRIAALDEDRRRERVATLQIADESKVGLPTGSSPLTQVGSVAVAQMAYSALQGVPADQSSRMCAKIGLLESPGKPLRFCNTYVGGGPGIDGLVGGAMISDFAAMASQLDAFNFGPLRISGAEVYLQVRRDLRQAFLLGARGPRTVTRGQTIRVRVRIRRVRQRGSLMRTIRIRVPRGIPRGPRALTLTGTSADVSSGGIEALTGVFDLGELFSEASSAEGEEGPRTLKALRRSVARIARYDGVTAAFLPPDAVGSDAEDPLAEDGDEPAGAEGVARRERRVYRDDRLRLSGQAVLRVEVR